MKYSNLRLQAAVALAIAAAATSVRADPPRYRVDIVGDHQSATNAFGLNNVGQVVGTRKFGMPEDPQGYVYSQGRVTRIAGLGFVPQLLDINDRGDIVGSTSVPGAFQHAFLYRDGRAINLSAPLGRANRSGAATAINEAGHVVGYAGAGRLFYFDGQASRLITHPDLPDSTGYQLYDINDHDAIAGSTDHFSFIYQDGTLTKIPPLASQRITAAWGINNAGQVTGVGMLADGTWRPFLYANGSTTSLGTLGGVTPDGDGGTAYDINGAGWVVGQSRTASLQEAGFLYMDGQMHNLNELLVPSAAARWNVDAGFRINDRGQIQAVGRGIGDDGGYTFLLTPTPVPEPGAYLLMLAGVGLVVLVVKRRLAAQKRRPVSPLSVRRARGVSRPGPSARVAGTRWPAAPARHGDRGPGAAEHLAPSPAAIFWLRDCARERGSTCGELHTHGETLLPDGWTHCRQVLLIEPDHRLRSSALARQ